MNKREKITIGLMLDEIMLGDDGDIQEVICILGKLIGRDYTQFAIAKDLKTTPIDDIPENSVCKAPTSEQ